MLKKTFISSMIFFSASTVTFATSTTYVGGSVGVNGYSQLSGLGAGASVFAGKGWFNTSEKLYIGTELGINAIHNSKYNNAIGIDASILPGVMLTKKTMLYSRLGLEGDHTAKGSDTFRFGTQVGLGLQTQITKKWDARVEYTAFSVNRPAVGLGLVYKFD
jgi:opacity protein-like surface antigen